MIYDVDHIPWWRFLIPLGPDGKPEKRYYRHRAHEWWVVRDGFRKPRVYWEDRTRQVRRATPPHFEKDTGVQTETITSDAEVQTVLYQDIWDHLRDSVSDLPVEMKVIIWERLERFLDMGLLYLRVPQDPQNAGMSSSDTP